MTYHLGRQHWTPSSYTSRDRAIWGVNFTRQRWPGLYVRARIRRAE